jgi:serine/threonine protein kinase
MRVAHAHGVIHRDIKPGNVFWVEDRGVLADFGVAKSLSHQTAATGAGERRGTPAYWAPEQLAGHDAVPQTDLYAVGMVLYEALSGERWETGALPERADWARVPAKMRPALRRALALSPEERWPDAAAFRRALAGRQFGPGAVLGVAGVVLGVLLALSLLRPLADVRIERLEIDGAGVPPTLGDSLSERLTTRLTNFPDFSVAGPHARRRARTTVTGTATVSVTGLLVRLHLPGRQR